MITLSQLPGLKHWANKHVGSLPMRRLAFAFAVAALSDVLSVWAELVLPLQWALDLATAFVLFLLLGRRWAILPGLVAEAIPGLAVFPAWILVVFSVYLLNDKKPAPQELEEHRL